MKRPIAFLDVFAERPLAGNGLAVVAEADGVADEVMLAFALETRLSETTFVQAPVDKSAGYRNRIWTPGEELPFAGHPSLGTAVAIARWNRLHRADYVQETAGGLHPIEVSRQAGPDRTGGERWRASMLQAPTEFGAELDVAATMAAVGLDPADAHPDLPPQIASAGVAHAIVPLAGPDPLGRVAPDYEAIDALLAPHGAVVAYLASCDTTSGRVRARGFARIAAIGEDPATGSAAGPLCAYLAERAGCDEIVIRQGEEMGRPGVIEAQIVDGRARVSGDVIPLIEGTVELPADAGDG